MKEIYKEAFISPYTDGERAAYFGYKNRAIKSGRKYEDIDTYIKTLYKKIDFRYPKSEYSKNLRSAYCNYKRTKGYKGTIEEYIANIYKKTIHFVKPIYTIQERNAYSSYKKRNKDKTISIEEFLSTKYYTTRKRPTKPYSRDIIVKPKKEIPVVKPINAPVISNKPTIKNNYNRGRIIERKPDPEQINTSLQDYLYEDDIEVLDNYTYNNAPEVALWAEVIKQAFYDLIDYCILQNPQIHGEDVRVGKFDAFFNKDNEHFCWICGVTNMDIDSVIKSYQNLRAKAGNPYYKGIVRDHNQFDTILEKEDPKRKHVEYKEVHLGSNFLKGKSYKKKEEEDED
jgi:hypothetical protein